MAHPQSSAGRILWTQVATLAGVVLVTLGLVGWNSATAWSQRADTVSAAAWGIRCLATATIAAGQVLFALGVLPAFFGGGRKVGRATLEQAYALAAGLLALLAAVAGGALLAASGWHG